ncbi:MAG: methyltransferase [Satyrvirus sp.]|uniref:Methyltransferase n=1 Tax=Satyrvirus sp. TaxID=2487771 RepID=A0A3G5ACW0_9VIRU|nr:MAG: methyltransferase [Satyrvirus sp.]
MEPIIYNLPKVEKYIEIADENIYFDEYPSPKLIKYGFNTINEQLDMVALTSNPYYKSGLNFDFERNDKQSMKTKANELLKTKDFNIDFAEFWEILNLFSILSTTQNIHTTKKNIVEDVVNTYQKLTGSKKSYIVGGPKMKPKEKVTLVIHKYSDIDIDENAAIHLIINDLKDLVSIQEKGANMVLQLFSLQTQTSSELLYYLGSLYNEAYLVKPIVTSNLSDSKYIVLLNLKEKNIKLPKLPKIPTDAYLISLGIKSIPNDFLTVIQCMNSQIIPKKYETYNSIKSYLDSKVYEGSTYQDMVKNQNSNTTKWFETFSDVGAENMKKILDQSIQRSNTVCVSYSKIIDILV